MIISIVKTDKKIPDHRSSPGPCVVRKTYGQGGNIMKFGKKTIRSSADIPYDPERSDTLIIYRSRKGSTLEYAKWIQESLDCDIVPFARKYLGYSTLYRNVILLSWLRSSEIVGLKLIRQNHLRFLLPEKHVILGVTGIAEPSESYEKYIREINFGLGFDYASLHLLPGRMDVDHQGASDRFMIRAFEKSQYDGMTKQEAEVFHDRMTRGWDGVSRQACLGIIQEIQSIRKEEKNDPDGE